MALAIRMARGGRKGRPFYRIVVADKRMPRDGRFVEKVGTYDPLLDEGHDQRLILKTDRVKHWIGQGAKPSERVARLLGKAGVIEMPKYNETPKKSAPGDKALERIKEKEEKAKEAEEAKKAAEEEAKAAAEAEKEAPAEEAKAEEAPAEDAKAEDAAEEKKAEA